MTQEHAARLVASVRQRLLNLSRSRGEDFNLILTWYGIERLLYRLAQSAHGNQFVLKGALLFVVWTGKLHRPTRDLDLLGTGEPSDDRLAAVFMDVCLADVEGDGLSFDPATVRVEEIRATEEYRGRRVRMVAMLGKARIPLQVDVGFGDAITPAAQELEYPTLLEFPAARLRVYPKESVVAEKLQAMVVLGMLNSRMGDFYDLWWMSRMFEFDGAVLARAIEATFARRRTAIPRATPVALTEAFALEPDKMTQWSAFLSRNRLDVGGVEFADVIQQLRRFLEPCLSALADGREWDKTWPEGGPWV
jgi:predicted nucleotidyltransferase component of viral defense system